jgi:hypothetical protein
VRAWIGGTTHQVQLNGSGDDREGQEHNAEHAQPNGDGQDGAGQPELPPAECVVDETQACLKNKRRCDRHSGWQKTVNAALELEERTLERRLQGLQDERDGVSRNLELDKAAQATRWVVDVHVYICCVMCWLTDAQVPRRREAPEEGCRVIAWSVSRLRRCKGI